MPRLSPRPAGDSALLHRTLGDWYLRHRRELPWRQPACSSWGVLVSEVMLQQTPVDRVLPVWTCWMARWPTPAHLAVEPPAAAIAAWARLGYPRRALRLHAGAQACVEKHGGAVPTTYADLRDLPGVGDYTAAAVAAFAFGRRHAVLDTNVRRVLARLAEGRAAQPAGAPSVEERARAEALLPSDGPAAARWNVGLMELGALVCTARSPDCAVCPLQGSCAWYAAGRPPWVGPPRRVQPWHGTDRQARGALLAVAREAYVAGQDVTDAALAAAWPGNTQRTRALTGLVQDGLLERVGRRYRLPAN